MAPSRKKVTRKDCLFSFCAQNPHLTIRLEKSMDSFIETYCHCKTSSKPKHIIQHHVTDILSSTLQPIFKKQALIHPTLTKRSQSRYGSKSIDIHQDQQWKDDYYVELLSWLLDNVSVSKALSLSHIYTH